MTQVELNELEEGKKWIEGIIHEAKNVTLPPQFNHLKRRIYQLRCTALHSESVPVTRSKLIMRYLLGFGFVILLLLKSKFNHNKINSPFSIWDSDIDPHATCEDFNTFLKSNQIINSEKEPIVFVKSNRNKKILSNAIFSQDPLYEILAFLRISYKDSFLLLKNICKNFYLYLKISSATPDTNGLFKDFLIEPIIRCYAKNGMIKFYRTNSNINVQEFWCEDIDFNTVWYSINSRAIQFKNMSLGPMPEYPLFYFMHLGTSWTWNKVHADWLKSFYEHPVKIIGPIMFYFFNPVNNKKSTTKRLLIFDVTPYEESFIRKEHYPKGINFYNEEYCIQFLLDIFKSFEGGEWEMSLKPKRPYTKNHSRKYIDLLSEIEKKNNKFKILLPQSNLFDEIEKSDLVISIPLSSPFDIAKTMNVPSIYFDPSGNIDFKIMGYGDDDYFCDADSLKIKIEKLSNDI